MPGWRPPSPAHGLDSSTFDVLATLLRSGRPYSLTPAALARDAMVSTSAVAQRLNKLEGRAWWPGEQTPTTDAAPWSP